MAIELRITLLLAGFAILVALYFFGRSKRKVHRHEDDEFNFEADDLPDPLQLDKALELDEDSEREVQKELSKISNLVHEDIAESTRTNKPIFKYQPSLLDEDPEELYTEEKLIIVHVAARRPLKFTGKRIISLTKELDLELDNTCFFHKNIERFGGIKSLYSVLNMVKPGIFDPHAMNEFETPGLSFVMRLPGPEEGLKAFNIMLGDAKKAAERLGGNLLDESRTNLSPQTIAHLQEEVQLFSLRYSRSN